MRTGGDGARGRRPVRDARRFPLASLFSKADLFRAPILLVDERSPTVTKLRRDGLYLNQFLA